MRKLLCVVLAAGVITSAPIAQERLDQHVRETVAWHFNPETGAPFWLERVKELAFDPRKEIHGFADLKKFGLFEDEWLRGGPVRRWVPRGLAHKPDVTLETTWPEWIDISMHGRDIRKAVLRRKLRPRGSLRTLARMKNVWVPRTTAG